MRTLATERSLGHSEGYYTLTIALCVRDGDDLRDHVCLFKGAGRFLGKSLLRASRRRVADAAAEP